jgi:hypothetical protein
MRESLSLLDAQDWKSEGWHRPMGTVGLTTAIASSTHGTPLPVFVWEVRARKALQKASKCSYQGTSDDEEFASRDGVPWALKSVWRLENNADQKVPCIY